MAALESFRDGWTALSTTPTLLVAGGLLVALSLAGVLDFGPETEPIVALGLLLTFPFVLGGFLGMAVAAVRDGESSLATFVRAGVANYSRLLAATVLFVAGLVALFTVLFALTLVPLVLLVLVDIGDAALVGAGITFALSVLATLLGIPTVLLFVQFLAPAIVAEDRSVAGAVRRSVALVRHNLGSVVGFTLLWVFVVSLVPHPEVLLEVSLTWLPATPYFGASTLVVAVASVLSTAALTYCYTVHTAYFLRLAGGQPAWTRQSDRPKPAGTVETQ